MKRISIVRLRSVMILLLLAAVCTALHATPYRSPIAVAFSPDGTLLAVSDRTAGEVVLIDVGSEVVARRIEVRGEPRDVAWSTGGELYVAEYGAGSVAQIDADTGTIVRRVAVGPKPVGIAIGAEGRILIVTNSGLNSVSVVGLADGKEIERLPTVREPHGVVMTPDGSMAIVGNLLPLGPSTDLESAAAVSLLDLSGSKKHWDIVLPSGSTAVRELTVSPDGKWGYVVHTVGKVALPLTHMFHGWVTTNALSVIDLQQRKHYATVLLDRLSTGAADPWGVALSADGTRLWVTLAGVHRVSEVDMVDLHDLLAGWVRSPIDSGSMYTPGRSGENPNRRQLLSMDVDELASFDVTSRIDLPGNGPRGLDLSPDGTLLAAAEYFSGDVVLVDTALKTVVSRIAIAGQPEPDAARRGERLFHDATITPEGWLSCATCHPEGRADGLNWDLPNDGTGNPKNAKSLLLAHRTPPAMVTGVRADFEVAVRAGFSSILFHRPQPGEDDDVAAYLSSLSPEPSPHLIAGKLSDLAAQGRMLFESPEVGCARCHPAPLFTNLQTRNVGTRHESDLTSQFDTPTLSELWRTGPYLHDGSAVTVAEVFAKFNIGDEHGRTSDLTKEEFDALIAYLLSL